MKPPIGPDFASARESGLDYNAGLKFRLLPLGGSLNGQVGYSQLLWQQDDTSPFYGFFRSSLKVSTSGVVNSVDARFDVYPISFINLSAGYLGSHRLTDIGGSDFVDCATVACSGLVSRTYIKAGLILGTSAVFAGGFVRYDWLQSADKLSSFYDEQWSLVGLGSSDKILSFDGVLGINFGAHRVGTYIELGRMRGSLQKFDGETLFYSLKFGNWRTTIGGGAYRSSIQDRGATLYITASWEPKPSLALF